MHFFKDRGYVAAMLSLSLGASAYYSQAIIWPDMASNVYGEGRAMWSGWVATLPGIGVTIGEMIGGSLAKLIGGTKYQCLTVITLGTLFLGCMFGDSRSLHHVANHSSSDGCQHDQHSKYSHGTCVHGNHIHWL